MEGTNFEGVKVRIGNTEWTLPSLSVSQAKRLWPEILAIQDKGVDMSNIPTQMEKCITIIHAALSRNYPQLTAEQVEEMVSISQLKQLMLVVSGQSGLKEQLPGEAEPAVVATPVVH